MPGLPGLKLKGQAEPGLGFAFLLLWPHAACAAPALLSCAGCSPCSAGSGAVALLTLLLGDSFFLPGNPPGQTKKVLKQRFLKLLPCCRPKSIPSLSESKCFFLPLCVCVSSGAAACPSPWPCPREGVTSTTPLLWVWGCQDQSCLRRVRSFGLCNHLCPRLLPGWFSPCPAPRSGSHKDAWWRDLLWS